MKVEMLAMEEALALDEVRQDSRDEKMGEERMGATVIVPDMVYEKTLLC